MPVGRICLRDDTLESAQADIELGERLAGHLRQ
jgi:hypothetical protein